eukprot:SAG11_NODE_12137_length_720_cov_1.199678_1_plen_92_part_00
MPAHQVGSASGWIGFFQQSGLLFGSLIGFAAGQNWIDQLSTGWLLIVLNLVAIPFGVLSFNERAGILARLLPEARKGWATVVPEPELEPEL